MSRRARFAGIAGTAWRAKHRAHHSTLPWAAPSATLPAVVSMASGGWVGGDIERRESERVCLRATVTIVVYNQREGHPAGIVPAPARSARPTLDRRQHPRLLTFWFLGVWDRLKQAVTIPNMALQQRTVGQLDYCRVRIGRHPRRRQQHRYTGKQPRHPSVRISRRVAE